MDKTYPAEPLFIDPYSACFGPTTELDAEHQHHHNHYCLATKFIDDRLLAVVKNIDGVKQVHHACVFRKWPMLII